MTQQPTLLLKIFYWFFQTLFEQMTLLLIGLSLLIIIFPRFGQDIMDFFIQSKTQFFQIIPSQVLALYERQQRELVTNAKKMGTLIDNFASFVQEHSPDNALTPITSKIVTEFSEKQENTVKEESSTQEKEENVEKGEEEENDFGNSSTTTTSIASTTVSPAISAESPKISIPQKPEKQKSTEKYPDICDQETQVSDVDFETLELRTKLPFRDAPMYVKKIPYMSIRPYSLYRPHVLFPATATTPTVYDLDPSIDMAIPPVLKYDQDGEMNSEFEDHPSKEGVSNQLVPSSMATKGTSVPFPPRLIKLEEKLVQTDEKFYEIKKQLEEDTRIMMEERERIEKNLRSSNPYYPNYPILSSPSNQDVVFADVDPNDINYSQKIDFQKRRRQEIEMIQAKTFSIWQKNVDIVQSMSESSQLITMNPMLLYFQFHIHHRFDLNLLTSMMKEKLIELTHLAKQSVASTGNNTNSTSGSSITPSKDGNTNNSSSVALNPNSANSNPNSSGNSTSGTVSQTTTNLNFLQLKLTYFGLTWVPIQILTEYFFSNISTIDLSHNFLVSIPEWLCDGLKMLTTLKLSHNFISDVSMKTGESMKRLKTLDLSNNELEFFPTTLLNLPNLLKLNLSSNSLTVIPNDIHRLKTLTDLDISNNWITHLPVEVRLLKKLKYLSFKDNFLVYPSLVSSLLKMYSEGGDRAGSGSGNSSSTSTGKKSKGNKDKDGDLPSAFYTSGNDDDYSFNYVSEDPRISSNKHRKSVHSDGEADGNLSSSPPSSSSGLMKEFGTATFSEENYSNQAFLSKKMKLPEVIGALAIIGTKESIVNSTNTSESLNNAFYLNNFSINESYYGGGNNNNTLFTTKTSEKTTGGQTTKQEDKKKEALGLADDEDDSDANELFFNGELKYDGFTRQEFFRKREYYLFQMLHSEHLYVQHLNIFFEVFWNPLINHVNTLFDDPDARNELKQFGMTIMKLVIVARDFLVSLQTKFSESSLGNDYATKLIVQPSNLFGLQNATIGDLFEKQAPIFKEVYIPFFNLFDIFNEKFPEYRKKSPEFEKFVQSCKKLSIFDGMSVEAFLALPLTRVKRYVHWLSHIMILSDPNSLEVLHIKRALSTLGAVEKYQEKLNSVIHNREKILLIQKKLKIKDLYTPNRRLIREGRLILGATKEVEKLKKNYAYKSKANSGELVNVNEVMDVVKDVVNDFSLGSLWDLRLAELYVHVYLLNDILIIKEMNMLQKMWGKYSIHELEGAVAKYSSENERQLILQTKKKVLIFLADTKEEMLLWHNDMVRAITQVNEGIYSSGGEDDEFSDEDDEELENDMQNENEHSSDVRFGSDDEVSAEMASNFNQNPNSKDLNSAAIVAAANRQLQKLQQQAQMSNSGKKKEDKKKVQQTSPITTINKSPESQKNAQTNVPNLNSIPNPPKILPNSNNLPSISISDPNTNGNAKISSERDGKFYEDSDYIDENYMNNQLDDNSDEDDDENITINTQSSQFSSKIDPPPNQNPPNPPNSIPIPKPFQNPPNSIPIPKPFQNPPQKPTITAESTKKPAASSATILSQLSQSLFAPKIEIKPIPQQQQQQPKKGILKKIPSPTSKNAPQIPKPNSNVSSGKMNVQKFNPELSDDSENEDSEDDLVVPTNNAGDAPGQPTRISFGGPATTVTTFSSNNLAGNGSKPNNNNANMMTKSMNMNSNKNEANKKGVQNSKQKNPLFDWF